MADTQHQNEESLPDCLACDTYRDRRYCAWTTGCQLRPAGYGEPHRAEVCFFGEEVVRTETLPAPVDAEAVGGDGEALLDFGGGSGTG